MNDDLLRELKIAMDVTPSPEFVAKLRQRVETERVVWRWPTRVIVALGTAAFLIGGVGIWMAGRQAAPAGIPRPVTVSSQPVVAANKQTMPPAPVINTEKPAVSVPTRRAIGNRAVLVPDDQRIAVAKLLESLRTGRAVALPSALSRFDADGNLLPPEPVVIEPLEIEPLPAMVIDDDSTGVGEQRSEL